MKKNIFIVTIIIIITFVFFLVEKGRRDGESLEGRIVVENFEDCVKAGYPVMESYPRQCRTSDGLLFTEDIGNIMEKNDLIRISSPLPNEEISSPLKIEGEARGYWFFEATFPIEIVDLSGNVIASSYASAKDEWMTEDFVSFESIVEFNREEITVDRGVLILRRANPSGLDENDDSLEIPIIFNWQ
jgi:hypothetical protein